jgi:excisionase family DNA binding protein
MPEFLTVPEVARRLRISRSQAYLLAERGELPVLRVGKLIRIPQSALEAWVRARTRMPGEGGAEGADDR